MERIGNFAPRIDIEIGSALRNNSDLERSRSCRERNCDKTKKKKKTKKQKKEKAVALTSVTTACLVARINVRTIDDQRASVTVLGNWFADHNE